MHKTLRFCCLLLFLTCLVLTACGGPVAPPPETAGDEADLPERIPDDVPEPARIPLTQEEIDFFNDEFFAPETLRSQFVTCLYRQPENVDLYSVFYNGLPEADRAYASEMEIVQLVADGPVPDCSCDKLPAAAMDAFLQENLGLSLDQTNRVGLSFFSYLPDFDAYYHFHGDTNAAQVTVTEGYREGDRVYLRYESGCPYADPLLCLKETEDGYVFYSNVDNWEDTTVALEDFTDLFARAEEAYAWFYGYARPQVGTETVQVEAEGREYTYVRVTDARAASLADLEAYLDGMFVPEITERLLATEVDGQPLFLDVDGEAYLFDGYIAQYSYDLGQRDLAQLIYFADGYGTLYLHYQTDEEFLRDPDWPKEVTQDYALARDDQGRWRFKDFQLPFLLTWPM